MKRILVSLLILVYVKAHAQNTADFSADHMQQANVRVLSCYKDTSAIGGFGKSDNKPLHTTRLNQFNEKGFYLFIDTISEINFKQKYKGFKFFIVNKSDSTIQFAAADSRLDIVAEAYVSNEWKPIEYLPGIFCGNSYHIVFLRRNHYWEVSIPKYSGEVHAMIRYKLQIDGIDYIYSNTYWGGINKAQLVAPEKFEW